MSLIRDVFARRILDSRGNPTIEVEVVTEDGSMGRAAAPSGASTGAHEVAAWPDGGVEKAVEIVDDRLAPELEDMSVLWQREIDDLLSDLDGSPNFSAIGGNTAVATSLAVARAAATSLEIPFYAYLGGAFVQTLPRPLGNVLGGGAHAVGGTDFQEYMVVPLGPSFAESVFAGAFAHKTVKELLKKELPGTAIGKGDEGAWVAPIDNVRALEIVTEAAKAASDKFGFQVRVALDVAATEFYDAKEKVYRYQDGSTKTPEEQADFLAGLVKDFELYSVEDGLAEDDWDGWIRLTKAVGDRAYIIGDDLFTTNPERLMTGINKGAGNAILVKPNQIGTLSRTVDTIHLAHENDYRTVISHRSGETTDDSIAHIGAAFGCIGIKTGVAGGERIAKLNELIRIEEEL